MKFFKILTNQKQFSKYNNEIIELYNQEYNIQTDLFEKASNQFVLMIKNKLITDIEKGKSFNISFESEQELIAKIKNIRDQRHILKEFLKNKYDYDFDRENRIDLWKLYQHSETRIYRYISSVFSDKSTKFNKCIGITYHMVRNIISDNIVIHIGITDISETYVY